jgi:hypothetical protein
MSGFENATKFFHACESVKRWDECSEYVEILELSRIWPGKHHCGAKGGVSEAHRSAVGIILPVGVPISAGPLRRIALA